jgi:hypothetical protein
MKRLWLGVTIFGGAALLGGCPIYPDQGRSYNSYPTCGGGCCTSADCGPGASCSPDGVCVAEVDASVSGECGTCPFGTVCTLAGGTLQCLAPGSLPDAGVEAVDATFPPPGMMVDTGLGTPPPDAAGASPESGTIGRLCNADSQCAPASGSKCIDGLCTAQSQLCSDATQCLAAGESCADGVCLPTCSTGGAPCPAGYECDYNRHVCAVNPGACTTTSDCKGGAVCVETRCVAPCASAEAGSQCPAGQVCVNGGCIPDQGARFTCQNDGNVGTLASTCDPTSICLHGDCYPMCDSDGGACAGPGEACKSVTIPKGTYFVCGTSSNLGSECNPAVGNYCDPGAKLCIDGYCR